MLAAVVGFAAPASVIVYNIIVSGGGVEFFTDWSRPIPMVLLFLIPLLFGWLLWNHSHREFVAAGAEWVAHNTGWVRTYDLIQVKIEIDAQPFLCLVDSDLRAARPSLREIQQNRDLWDLVYNGILYSFEQRYVHTNGLTRRILELHGPAMRNQVRLAREGPRPDEFVIVDRTRWWRRAPRRYRRGERQ